MSKADIMGLGPFLKALGERLDRMTKEEICRVLIQRGKTIPSIERRVFLSEFESVPPATPERSSVHDDRRLIADIRAFIADLENGKYYEGTGFDPEVRDYCSYGDESWVERMDDLFDRAGAVFLNGNKPTAAEAYGMLLHAFDMGEEDGHFCGATHATDMVATDLDEAKGRYCRALYETTPAKDRPALMLKEMHALRYRGRSDPSIKVVFDAETAPPPEWSAFLNGWVKLLSGQDPEDTALIMFQLSRRLLREAIMLRDGLPGLAKLADECGSEDPALFQEWIDELLRLDRKAEACDVARRATAVVGDPRAKAVFAEQWATLAKSAADVLEARRVAWRSSPTIDRLLLLYTANAPSSEESQRRVSDESAQWRSGKVELNDRLAAVLSILGGDYDGAAAILAKSNPLGWSHGEHPGAAVYPFLLLAVAQGKPLPKGCVLSLWRYELDALDRVGLATVPEQVAEEQQPAVGLWATMEGVLRRKPLAAGQRERLLDLTCKVMLARVRGIVENQNRGAYDRAARMLVGWIEAARFAGRATEAETLLAKVRKDYSRRPAFRREIEALVRAVK
jgi:hypothetical protein